mgnify:CR=1 FL=1
MPVDDDADQEETNPDKNDSNEPRPILLTTRRRKDTVLNKHMLNVDENAQQKRISAILSLQGIKRDLAAQVDAFEQIVTNAADSVGSGIDKIGKELGAGVSKLEEKVQDIGGKFNDKMMLDQLRDDIRKPFEEISLPELSQPLSSAKESWKNMAFPKLPLAYKERRNSKRRSLFDRRGSTKNLVPRNSSVLLKLDEKVPWATLND